MQCNRFIYLAEDSKPRPPPPPHSGGQPYTYACSRFLSRDTPFKDGNGLGVWPHITGFWKGSHQNYPPITGFWKGSHQNYPPITGFWKGSQQNYPPPPHHRFLEGKLANLPPKWRKSAEVKSVHNFSTCMDRIVRERFENYPYLKIFRGGNAKRPPISTIFRDFPPNWAPKIYPFSRKIGNAHAVQMTTWVGGGGGGGDSKHSMNVWYSLHRKPILYFSLVFHRISSFNSARLLTLSSWISRCVRRQHA